MVPLHMQTSLPGDAWVAGVSAIVSGCKVLCMPPWRLHGDASWSQSLPLSLRRQEIKLGTCGWSKIEAHWASHCTLALADKEDGTNPNKKPIWKVLQVHPKAVALFLHGQMVEEGLSLFAESRMLVPLASPHLPDGSEKCVRMAKNHCRKQGGFDDCCGMDDCESSEFP